MNSLIGFGPILLELKSFASTANLILPGYGVPESSFQFSQITYSIKWYTLPISSRLVCMVYRIENQARKRRTAISNSKDEKGEGSSPRICLGSRNKFSNSHCYATRIPFRSACGCIPATKPRLSKLQRFATPLL